MEGRPHLPSSATRSALILALLSTSWPLRLDRSGRSWGVDERIDRLVDWTERTVADKIIKCFADSVASTHQTHQLYSDDQITTKAAPCPP
jgi:hypothetical protein